jgi:hypothetical protein
MLVVLAKTEDASIQLLMLLYCAWHFWHDGYCAGKVGGPSSLRGRSGMSSRPWIKAGVGFGSSCSCAGANALRFSCAASSASGERSSRLGILFCASNCPAASDRCCKSSGTGVAMGSAWTSASALKSAMHARSSRRENPLFEEETISKFTMKKASEDGFWKRMDVMFEGE